MKTFQYIYLFFSLIFLASCSTDNTDTTVTPVNETAGLIRIKELSNENHTIELYSDTGILKQGYNAISLRIKDKTTGQYQTEAAVSWTPVMHMTTMEHSCPKSPVTKAAGTQSLYTGEIVFQMAQNDTESWTLTVDYTLNGISYSATDTIAVFPSEKRTVSSFTGTDGTRYIVAYIAPKNPAVALNDMTVGVFRMENMMSFPIVDNYKIKIDPRMPGMGNHGSPYNTDLTQTTPGKLYHGKLSLTMTGYWKINLQLLNASGQVLKGEPVTTDNPQSSLFFEIEF